MTSRGIESNCQVMILPSHCKCMATMLGCLSFLLFNFFTVVCVSFLILSSESCLEDLIALDASLHSFKRGGPAGAEFKN